MVLTHVDLIEKLLHYNRMCSLSLLAKSHPYQLVLTILPAMERTKDRGQYVQ